MSIRPTLTKWLTPRTLTTVLHTPLPTRRVPTFPTGQQSFTAARFTRTPFPRSARRFNSTKSGDGAKGSSSSSSSSSSSAGSGSGAGATETGSLSARLKKLSREYGWAALGVYLGLSALDFPFCFAAVRLLGVERIGYYEHAVVGFVKDKLKAVWPVEVRDGGEDGQGQLAQAEERNQEEASIWTQLVFAYAIHKSFIFIRVPLTAAVTPKVVKTLRGWGWDIGKRKPKST